MAGRAFLLGFSRPLVRQRCCDVWKRWIGTTTALVVRVVHQGEAVGRHMTAVDRVDPYFKELLRLRRERLP